MKKLINFIVDKKLFFIGLFSVLFIASIFLFQIDNTNYDLTTYLSKESNTKIVLDIMNQDFNANGNFIVMIDNISKEDARKLATKFLTVDDVTFVSFDEESIASYKDGHALYTIYLENSNFSSEAKKALSDVEKIIDDYNYHTSGGVVQSQFLSDSVVSDMIVIMGIACIIVLLLLILNSVSWIEPLIFLIVTVVAIIINMGTNSLLPSVSFITKSICAVMQLALAMDYSIILLHHYSELLEENSNNPTEVMKKALKETMLPILGSSLTTVGGLFAIVCMTFTLGKDIGIVLIKGIIISLLSVFFLMPGLTILFTKLILKTKHRSLYQIIKNKTPKAEEKINSYQIKTRHVYTIFLILIIPFAFYFYTKAGYSFSVTASNDENSVINCDKKAIEEVFGINNSFAVMIPTGQLETEKEVINLLNNYQYNGQKAFSNVQSLVALGLLDEVTYEELASRYGINEIIIQNVYLEIDPSTDQNTKLKVIDVLELVNDKDIQDHLFEKVKIILEDIINQIQILDEKVTTSGLVNIIDSSYFKEENAKYLLDTIPNKELTYEQLLIYLQENEYLQKYINNLKQVVSSYELITKPRTREEINLYFKITDESLFSYPDNLSYLQFALDNQFVNCDNDIKEIIKEVQSINQMCIKTYTKNEALEKDEFKLLPSSLLSILYFSSQTRTYYDLCKNISSSSLVIDSINNMIEKINEYYHKITVLNSTITSSSLGVSNEYMEKLFGTKEIDVKNALIKINNNNLLIDIKDIFVTKISELIDKVNYAKKMFVGENYTRIVANLLFPVSSKEAKEICDKGGIKKDLDLITTESYIVTETISELDLRDEFVIDNLKINLISFVFIFVIIAISFRSLLIPLILTLVIEGSIWITMSTNYFFDKSAYFICYLLVVSIQMGVTIDYAILFTNKYITERKTNRVEESLKNALSSSLPTILTSGSILVIASFLVYKFSSLSIISEIGFLLSKGSLISIVMILLFLPQLLCFFDKLIMKNSSK